MPITRDQEFPAEIAQLVASFNRCADGHEMINVVIAAGNMLSAAIHNYGAMSGMSDDQMMEFARDACEGTLASVELNWKRRPKPTDLPVKPQ